MSEPRCYECGHILADINAWCPNCAPNPYEAERQRQQRESHQMAQDQKAREYEEFQRAESATDLVTPDMGEGELEFWPCDKCRLNFAEFESKLCEGCDHNRAVIGTVQKQVATMTDAYLLASEDNQRTRAQAFRKAAEAVCPHCKAGHYLRTSIRCGYEHIWASFQKDCKAAAIHKLADEAEKG